MPFRIDEKYGFNFDTKVGQLDFPKGLIGKTIPYKYVVVLKGREYLWEYIFYSHKLADRCLIVPNVSTSFAKYDDVILKEDWSNAHERVRKGRSMATKWMLPRLSELDDAGFDILAAKERFEQVVRAHEPQGTRICIESLSLPYNPNNYSADQEVKFHIKNFLNRLKSYLKQDGQGSGKILKAAVYICLVRKSKYCFEFDLYDYLAIFKAFFDCSEVLFNDGSPLLQVSGGFQEQVCEALKSLVQDFVSLPVGGYECNNRGNWIHAIPYIHRWDLPERNDATWLKLKEWKQNLKYRYEYLHFA